MKITDAPGEINVDAMLDVFHAVIRDVPELPFDDIEYVRMDGRFSHFVDPEVQSLWIGFALGHRARDRLGTIPEQRSTYGAPVESAPAPAPAPALWCIGEYLAGLADTLEAAGVDQSLWKQWRKDGQIVKGACIEIVDARRLLLNTFYWMSGHPEFQDIKRDIKGALRRLGVAIDRPHLEETSG